MLNQHQSPQKPGAIIIEGHVQGLSNTRSLGEANIPVYVVDKTDCIARYSKYCRKFFKCPDFINDEFAGFLVELAIKENIKDWVLIPSNDHAVYTISKHKERLGHHFKVITPELNIIENIYDKLRLLDIAKKNNVAVPVTQNFLSVYDEISKKLPFPVLTKGRNGLSFYKSTGKKAFLARNEAELRIHLSFIDQKYKVPESFTQAVIQFNGTNKTISVTAFCIKGVIKTVWMGEKLREHPIQFGTATFCRSLFIEDLIEPSKKLVNALNYTGVCEIEYLKDPEDNKYKLIEINARTWLWVGLARSCGVDFALYIYNFVNNIETEYPNSYKIDVYWINSITDVIFAAKAIFKKKLTINNYFKTLGKRKVRAVGSLQDVWPSILFPYLLLVRAIKKK